MTDVQLSRKNAVYLKLKCEPHIEKELSEDFTFFVPNYQFNPLYKKKLWDGKHRLYNLHTHAIYMGLLDEVLEWCKRKGYSTDYEPPCNAFNPAALEEWIDSLCSSWNPRDYQVKIVRECLEHGMGLILSPTASGKSFLIYLLMRYYAQKTLIIVPTINLVEQLASDFVKYGYDAGTQCHCVYYPTPPDAGNKPITISTWQSLINQPSEFFERFGVVFVDEAHGADAKSLISILSKLTNAYHRFGLTGTMKETKTHELTLKGLFGPTIRGESTASLIEQGYLAKLQIISLILDYPEEDRHKRSYHEEMKFLDAHEGRKVFLRNLMLSMKGSTFVLFQRVDRHGAGIFDDIRQHHPNVHFVYGGTDVDVREEVRALADLDDETLVVASYGVFAQGVNVPNLRNIICASDYKSKVKVLQAIGRSLRKTEDKMHATVFDIVDNLSMKTHTNFAVRHYIQRVKLYCQERFPYQQIRVKMGEEEGADFFKKWPKEPSPTVTVPI